MKILDIFMKDNWIITYIVDNPLDNIEEEHRRIITALYQAAQADLGFEDKHNLHALLLFS